MTAPTIYQSDIITDNTNALSSKTQSIAHSATGSNQLLLVWVFAANDAVAAASEFTSVTWNGVALTRHTACNAVASYMSWMRHTMFYLVAPANGTHDLVVTYDNTSGKANTGIAIYYMFVQDVDQSSPIDVGNKTEVTSASPSISLTTTSDNSLMVAGMGLSSQNVNPVTPTGSPTPTELLDADQELHGLWLATRPTTTAGSNAIACTINSSVAVTLSAIALKEAPAASGTLARRRTGLVPGARFNRSPVTRFKKGLNHGQPRIPRLSAVSGQRCALHHPRPLS